MPSFLVTHKMNPELRARVMASLGSGGARSAVRPRSRAGLTAMVRIVLIGTLLSIAFLVWETHQMRKLELDGARDSLLGALRRENDSLTAKERTLPARVEPQLLALSQSYAGDEIGAELGSPEKLAELVHRPLVYVRGPVASFRHSAQIQDAAAESAKDSFVLCLLAPPAEKTERVLLEKAFSALAGGAALEAVTSNVHRLADALAILPMLSDKVTAQVQASENVAEIQRLHSLFKAVPIARGKKAMGAELLLAVMDEPKDAGTITELDGASPHHVRVGLWDVGTGKTVVRLRRHVDPSWISLRRRSKYAHELDSCKLAVDIREELLTR